MIKRFFDIRILSIIAFLCLPALSWGVTQKEMEEARTIAAKAYIRYANDGSGYLDALNPKTMEELEASLKPKEKENIKAFKAIKVPTDYKSWGKEQLVEYWAVTAFQDKGLIEKGRGGRIRARTQINKMTIAPPQPEAPSTPSAPTESTPNATDSASNNLTADLNPENAGQSLAEAELEEDLNVAKESNYTWVYIMILAILVAIVVILVVYAANVMKKNPDRHPRYDEDEEDEESKNYESLIADKDVEIAMLKKKLDTLTKQNSELKSQLENSSKEIASLKEAHQASFAPVAASTSGVVSEQKEKPTQEQPQKRSIYLGRANARGIFVRADRTLNVGNSVFRLETTDGFSGTFRVADSPAAWSLALSNPKEYLSAACTGHNLEDTSDASRIINEAAGTAVFEGGCWRVIRKAKIRYE